MAFGFIYKKWKKASPIPSYFVIGAGFFLMAAVPNKGVALIACALMGAAWGIFYSFSYTRCTVVVPEKMQGTAIGITGAVSGLASFFCTYVVTGLKSLLHSNSSLSVWPILGGICIIVGISAIIGYIKNKE